MQNRYGIRIAGPAGLGMHSVMDIIANTFSTLGYNVITDSEYQSIIKGGLNFYDVNICSASPYIAREVDVLISLNEKNITPNLVDLRKGGLLIANKKWIEKVEIAFPTLRTDFVVIDPLIQDKYENTYLVGMLAGYIGVDISAFEPWIAKSFQKKGEETVAKNLQILKEYAEIGRSRHSERVYPLWGKNPGAGDSGFLPPQEGRTPKQLTYGNKAIAYGAMDSELEFYSAYPMTPASTILSEIVNAKRIPYLQAEDEIAVMNAALGASFTGARAMVGTSGGGFALMTEALSFAAEAEFPIVAVLSQRAGPSTGTPTYHEQGDMLYAVRPTFGDIENVVMIPSSMEEGYYMGGQSLNIAQKYQTTVILLTDKQFSEGKVSIGELVPAPVERGKLITNPATDYKRYELTDDGISPYVRVGTEQGDFIATSYEHDEYGATTEDMLMKVKMTEKRAKKLQNFFEKEGIYGYEVVNPSAKKKMVTTSFNAYTARAFVEQNPEWGLVIIKFLAPVDVRLRDEFAKCEKIVFVENNYSGQLEGYLTKELGLAYIAGLEIGNLRKYDLLPFYMEDLNSLI
ncbi:MAG: 2-oxoacid:acceptor oxidoreductase family protein [Candidatus Gracilibacteria bacterium]|nr:2-oxoacid:acceptor oxidoreductase family protein [Candidatus Gracilibacteria bacterium]